MRGAEKRSKPLGAFSKNRRRHPQGRPRKDQKATAAEIFSPLGPQSLQKVVLDLFRPVKYREFEATRLQNIGLATFFFKICSQTDVLEACCFKFPVFYGSKKVQNHFLERLGPQGAQDFSGCRFLVLSWSSLGVPSSIFAECSERFASFFGPPSKPTTPPVGGGAPFSAPGFWSIFH